MKFNTLFLTLVLIIFFSCFVQSATSKDFVKISVGEDSFFTHKDIVNADYYLGTDKIFYGSKEGSVIIKVFFAGKDLIAKDFKIGLRTKNGKNITVKKIKIGVTEIEINNPQPSNTFYFNQAIRTENGLLQSIEIYLNFDPNEIGFFEEFDIILYDKFGNIILIFDPFLSGYNERYALNIGSTHSAISSGYTHEINAVDMSTWDCTDSNQVAITFQVAGTPTEIDAVINGTCGTSSDASILFKAQTNIPENTGLTASDTNGYYAYVTTEVVPDPKRDCTNVFVHCDNFEDGAITGWAYVEGGGVFSATTTQAYEGVYSMLGDNDNFYQYPVVDLTTSYDSNISFWVRTTATGVNGSLVGFYGSIQIGWNRGGYTNKFALYSPAGGYSDFSGTNPDIQADKWYKFLFHQIDSTHSNVYVYDSDGTTKLAESINLEHTAYADSYSVTASSPSGTTYIDYTVQQKVLLINPVYTIGEKETSAISPDVNVSYPQNNEQFEQGAISTIEITFNVEDGDSNSLLVDLNYSASNTEGSGTAILTDENTTGGSIVCDDSDFSNVTNCAYTWNINAIPDGNYYILINVNDGTNETFDAGDLNFSIYTTPPIEDYNITFNVFQNTGTDFNLSGLTIDFNVDAYDQSGLTSPFTITDINAGLYAVTISKTGWDSNSFELSIDENATVTYYLDKFVYPTITQFTKLGDNNTFQTSFQSIQTWSFETSYGSSTKTDVGCSFWITSDNIATSSATWRIQTSENGTVWTTRKETTRTVNPNTSGGSIFIQIPDFNILDGTHYFRLQHKIAPGNIYNLDTHDVVCEKFISRDQNNFIIQDFGDTQTNLSTSSTNYLVAETTQITTQPFNGFYYYFGDMIYSQTIAKGIGYIKGDLKNIADSNSAEYPRTTLTGFTGIGGFSGMFEDLNASNLYDVQTYTKTSAGTTAFSYDLHLKYLNQKPFQYDQNKNLNGVTLATSTLSKIATITINPITKGDFRAFAVLPFSCSNANCDLNIVIGASGNGYDLNSFSNKRTSDINSGDIGVLVTQFLFSDVNTGTINFDLWGSTSTGTITFKGGSFSVIKANETNVLIENPPQDPLVYSPINGSDVNGALVDYNCWTTDPDFDPLLYDVNIIFKDTNALALNLENHGTGNGTFDSTILENGVYNIACSVTDGNFTVRFDNVDYNFSITNIPVPPVYVPPEIPYDRYFNPDDPRENLIDTNRFLSEEKAFSQDPFNKLEFYALFGIIVIIILFIIYVLFVRRS